MAGGGEEKAVFEGLKNDAEQYLPQAAHKAATFAETTAEGVDKNVAEHVARDAQLGDDFTNLAERPPEAPAVSSPTAPASGGSAGRGPGVLSDEPVAQAGVESGGVSSAETGATDPVDLVSGQLLETAIDVSLPGVLPLVLRRSYASGYRHGALLGPGWSCTLDARLLVDGRGRVSFLGDDAQRLDYGVPSGLGLGLASYPDYGARWALARDAGDGAWTVTNPETGIGYRFAPEGACRPILAIRDRCGNEIHIQRDENQNPVLIVHSGGYRVRLESTEVAGEMRLAGYWLETEDGPQQLVGFGYDGAGQLAAVTDTTGAAHCYEYDEHDRITAWTDKLGYRYPYRYDSAGRVVETGVAGGFKHATLAYKPGARETAVTDALGHTTIYRYNRFQQITAITDPAGAETKIRKDAYGRLLEHTTPLGHTTSFAYDADGNRTAITYPDGHSVRMAYHVPGLLARIDLPNSASWHYTYDERGNPRTETDPLGGLTRFDYDERGAVVAVTDPLGAQQRYELDPVGLPIAAIDPAGSRTGFTRDRHGRVVSMAAPNGAIIALERDSEGRVTAQSAPDGATTCYAYDEAGNRTAITEPSGRVTRFEYGPFYTPFARTDPDGSRYVFGYDAELHLTEVIGPTGLRWSYTYDAGGLRVAERDFDEREQRYAFDADGRLTEHTAADGQATAYRRDGAGRLLELRSEDGAGARFSYDPVGHLTRAVNRHATVTWTRDLLGRAIREEINGQAVNRSFDAAGNLTGRTTGSGVVSTWAYDALGDAASLQAGSETIRFARDLLGREVRREFGTVALTQNYDAAGQLTGQHLTAGRSVLQQRGYSYDADGLPTRINDMLRGTRVMDLDPIGRITAVHHGDAAERYAYDRLGNLTETFLPHQSPDTDTGATLGAHTLTGTRTTRAGRTDYSFDAKGRLTGKTRRTLSGRKLAWSYTWDAQDKLTAVTRPDGAHATYRYDALGRRIGKTLLNATGQVTEAVTFGWDGTLVVEQTAHRPDAPTTTTTWDYEPGSQLLAAQRRSFAATPPDQSQPPGDRTEGQGQVDVEFWAIITDLIGTPKELVTSDGHLDWVEQSPLWGTRGDLGTSTPTASCPLGFPGQYHDPETGLYYNNQRYYDPDTAAYLSPDPLGLDAADNAQRYVPNPLTATDPLGLTPQAPATGMKSDDELQADADKIREGFKAHGKAAYNNRVVATYQADDGSLYYSVNSSKSYKGMDDLAKNLGYTRISGKAMEGPEQTDAEQLMLNAVDKKIVPGSGRIATTQIPCGEFRNSGKVAQNCAKRLSGYVPKIRIVGRYSGS